LFYSDTLAAEQPGGDGDERKAPVMSAGTSTTASPASVPTHTVQSAVKEEKRGRRKRRRRRTRNKRKRRKKRKRKRWRNRRCKNQPEAEKMQRESG
jgi:hypothetical protein